MESFWLSLYWVCLYERNCMHLGVCGFPLVINPPVCHSFSLVKSISPFLWPSRAQHSPNRVPFRRGFQWNWNNFLDQSSRSTIILSRANFSLIPTGLALHHYCIFRGMRMYNEPSNLLFSRSKVKVKILVINLFFVCRVKKMGGGLRQAN